MKHTVHLAGSVGTGAPYGAGHAHAALRRVGARASGCVGWCERPEGARAVRGTSTRAACLRCYRRCAESWHPLQRAPASLAPRHPPTARTGLIIAYRASRPALRLSALLCDAQHGGAAAPLGRGLRPGAGALAGSLRLAARLSAPDLRPGPTRTAVFLSKVTGRPEPFERESRKLRAKLTHKYSRTERKE
mgnify:CR=1 FL=1